MRFLRIVLAWPIITLALWLCRWAYWSALLLEDPKFQKEALRMRNQIYEARREMLR